MTHTGNSTSDQLHWRWDSDFDTLERSNSAYKGWGTRYRKEIDKLKKEQINLRMAYDKHVNGV